MKLLLMFCLLLSVNASMLAIQDPKLLPIQTVPKSIKNDAPKRKIDRKDDASIIQKLLMQCAMIINYEKANN